MLFSELIIIKCFLYFGDTIINPLKIQSLHLITNFTLFERERQRERASKREKERETVELRLHDF